MPNAGWPERVSGRIMYPAVPEYFGDYALDFWQAGAGVIGGCCGTTPQHIQAMARAIQSASPEEWVNVHSPLPLETDDCGTCDEQPTQLAQKIASGHFAIAVEMDPPRGVSTHKLLAGASLLAESGADVINVADSPMARMRMSPWAVCSLIQNGINIETVVHFPTRGRSLLRIQGDLLAAHALDVRNVFVVMGDPTAIGDYPDAMDNYDLVPSGLIKLIKQGFNTGVDHAGMDIGQPTSFFVGCALNFNPADPAQEMKSLHRKIKFGADFLLTQPVYQPEIIHKFLEQYQEIYGPLNTPILAGILPLVNARHASFLHHEVPGINIPEKIYNHMQTYGDKDPHVGIEIAIELIEKMKPYIQGIYLIPAFGRYDQAAEIIEAIRRAP
jgi:5,10-methylenetetrahydrofolate reductase